MPLLSGLCFTCSDTLHTEYMTMPSCWFTHPYASVYIVKMDLYNLHAHITLTYVLVHMSQKYFNTQCNPSFLDYSIEQFKGPQILFSIYLPFETVPSMVHHCLCSTTTKKGIPFLCI